MALNSEWFAEDRKFPKEEIEAQKKETEKALRNSTVIVRRLTQILEQRLKKCDTDEEQVDEAYPFKVAQVSGKRKAYKDILNLLDFKEVKTND